MKIKILIIGSTGKLGTKLLNYTNKNSIKFMVLLVIKIKKLIKQKKNINIKKSFVLSDKKR